MEGIKYTINLVAELLEVSTSTIAELKKKLNIGYHITPGDYLRLRKIVMDIKKTTGGKVSLSKINDFLLNHDIGDY